MDKKSLVGKSNEAALGDKELNVDGHDDKIEANDTIKTSMMQVEI